MHLKATFIAAMRCIFIETIKNFYSAELEGSDTGNFCSGVTGAGSDNGGVVGKTAVSVEADTEEGGYCVNLLI